jgi:hypothetical protein
VTNQQFSEHDPNGQAIRTAAGLASYDRRGWRRVLVPLVLAVVVLAALALGVALLNH